VEQVLDWGGLVKKETSVRLREEDREAMENDGVRVDVGEGGGAVNE
jgi:hypothetical protein